MILDFRAIVMIMCHSGIMKSICPWMVYLGIWGWYSYDCNDEHVSHRIYSLWMVLKQHFHVLCCAEEFGACIILRWRGHVQGIFCSLVQVNITCSCEQPLSNDFTVEK